MIKAPYNFVPLNEVVFTPPSDDQISHDIPFSDGESGWIQIKLTAASPVYVRNGGDWTEDNATLNANPEYQSFSRFNSRYFIPGTSIKGMIRNVLEIMSFGKMGSSRTNDNRFSYRDLSNSPDGNAYKNKITTQRNNVYTPKVKAGWLRKEIDGAWNLTPCEFARVNFSNLTTYYTGNIDLRSLRASRDKYLKWLSNGNSLDLRFDFELDSGGNVKEQHPHSCGQLGYKNAVNLGAGAVDGTLVFTGQPPASRKHMEFVFHSPASDSYDVSKLKKDFLFIHSERNGLLNPELRYMIEDTDSLRNGEMPVFYLEEGGGIHSMGLAMMYRLPFDNSIHDLLPDSHKTEHTDLTDQIFGTISEDSLRGRVQFSHAFAGCAKPLAHPVTTVLGGPKASYSPNYLQEGGTYRNANSRIKGWKRYPVHPSNSRVRHNHGTDNVSTTFTPLEAGAEFICKIRFHNLRKAELGALLSALTFHGHEDNLFHSLGMAKPLGYGKIKLEIMDIHSHGLSMENHNEYLNSFVTWLEDGMNSDDGEFNWREQPQIEELLTMAKEQNNRGNSRLEYMTLNMEGDNEFADAKNSDDRDQNHLKKYSELENVQTVTLQTIDEFEAKITTDINEDNFEQVLAMSRRMSRNKKFLKGLTKALVAPGELNNSWNDLYNKVQYEPEIILLQAPDLNDKEVKRRICNIRVPDKSDSTIRKLFNYLLKRSMVTPKDIPGWAQSIAYGWEDLNLTEDQLLGEMDNLGEQLWPTVESLKNYIEKRQFADTTAKELCLGEITAYFNNN